MPFAAFRHHTSREGFEVVFTADRRLEGHITAVFEGRPYAISYAIDLDEASRTRRATVSGRGRAIALEGDGSGPWTLDGDPVYDRAVGPMQFIPTTWRTSATDADGDGTADPNDIDDAALAAAGYLCANNRDLATPEGWWAAVLSYNNVQSYAEQVFATANEYGQRSG